jgi:hypothetical protein
MSEMDQAGKDVGEAVGARLISGILEDGDAFADAAVSDAEPSLSSQLRDLKGTAKDADWVSSDGEGAGVRGHYAKHGDDVGATSAREYDLSARKTIQDGRRFTYRDPTSNEPRVGYYDPETGLFTGTSQTRGTPAILTHFKVSWQKIRTWPGFSTG